ncbi:MAG: DUF2520 domain-containing protein [Candidatus Rokuibacteriota bacterium]|nr:MAG: DUF2520 domain-containing protein [Candidatus Rokubacteria bacterium]
MVFDSVNVIGAGGRAGSAISARLRQAGLSLRDRDAELVLLCVPDSAIAEVAARVRPGPWLAHVSGATQLSALDPHERRFSVHPLQTLVSWRGPEQLDGAYAAVTAETEEAREQAVWLAQALGMEPFELPDADRALYHAGAVIASNFLVTLYRTAARLVQDAGAPPEALVPLMRRTMENDFELTGPITRGDSSTVSAHLEALRKREPGIEPMYRALAEATKR